MARPVRTVTPYYHIQAKPCNFLKSSTPTPSTNILCYLLSWKAGPYPKSPHTNPPPTFRHIAPQGELQLPPATSIFMQGRSLSTSCCKNFTCAPKSRLSTYINRNSTSAPPSPNLHTLQNCTSSGLIAPRARCGQWQCRVTKRGDDEMLFTSVKISRSVDDKQNRSNPQGQSIGAGWVIKMIKVLAAENSIIPLFTDWNVLRDFDGMMNYTSIKFKQACVLFSKGCCRSFWARNPLHSDYDMSECLDLLMTDLANFGYQIKECKQCHHKEVYIGNYVLVNTHPFAVLIKWKLLELSFNLFKNTAPQAQWDKINNLIALNLDLTDGGKMITKHLTVIAMHTTICFSPPWQPTSTASFLAHVTTHS
eukprot:3655968-Rhodomonas_salina.2